MMHEKIRPHHLERKAILYVRQPSAHQVLHNHESSAQQYAMGDRLVALGWSCIEDAFGSIARLGTSDDETVDQHAVYPAQKIGLRARTIYWERRARISSWTGCNSSPLA